MSEEHLEAELTARIDPWLQHMRWRSDFAAWRERRLYQERHQGDKIASVRECLGSLEGRCALDIGAGMGGFSVALAQEGVQAFTLEFNGDYCQIIRLRGQRYQLDLPVAQGVGEDLPFPEQHFDLVCAWDVLEHVHDPQALLREAHRVLRSGGVFVLTVVNRWAFRDPHYHLPLLNWMPRSWAEWWIRRAARGKEDTAFTDRQSLSQMHYFTFAAFCRLAQSAGFLVEDLQEKRLRQGTLSTRRPWRRALRRLVRLVGLERTVYRLARSVYLSSFEVALWKTS